MKDVYLQIIDDSEYGEARYEYYKQLAKEQNVLDRYNDNTKTIWLSGPIKIN